MAIKLVTGVPGSGKTAYVVDLIIAQEGKRPIIVDGIPELQLDADPAPPIKTWTEKVEDDSSQDGHKLQFSFPVGSLVVIDECQRVFPRRAVGKAVPDYVAAFETHRHRGLDFILITQHPRLLDSHVRSLVGSHVHIRQTWQGRHKYEWSECQDPESTAARRLAARDRYQLPKRAFTRYKSAELHTKQKHKLPFYFWLLLIGILIAGGAFFWSYQTVKSKMTGDKPAENFNLIPSSSAPGKPGQQSGGLTKAEYFAALQPRIAGLHHTAPAYDGITQPVDAPIPVACVQNHTNDTCRCMDQQGNNYDTSPGVCQSFVKNGMFIPWRDVQKERKEAEAAARADRIAKPGQSQIAQPPQVVQQPPVMPVMPQLPGSLS